jgi:type IV fimbrial biogenesis protein FimT
MTQNLRRSGFTLIELLVALSLFALLLAMAVPMYVTFLASSQVRNAAEAMLNGVLLTQGAAIKDNTPVQLVVAPGTGAAAGWTIQVVNPDTSAGPAPQVPAPYLLSDGAPNVLVATTPAGATEVTFDAFGRIVPNADASQTISCIQLTNAGNGNARALTVVVSNVNLKTGTMLCDPAAAVTEPQACPAAACA